MFLFSFVLLAQEAFLCIEKTHCRLVKLVQGTNSGKNKPKLLLTKLQLLNFPNLVLAFIISVTLSTLTTPQVFECNHL